MQQHDGLGYCLISCIKAFVYYYDNGYLATSDALPGLVAEGRTKAEAIEIAQDVARKLIESYIEHGDPLPSEMALPSRTVRNIKIPVAVTE